MISDFRFLEQREKNKDRAGFWGKRNFKNLVSTGKNTIFADSIYRNRQ
jgi:hypothetical protein